MSIRRLLATAAGMAAVATALRALTPDLSPLFSSGLDVQRVVDAHGPEHLLLSGVAVLAWAIWAWGVLGLLLTALSGLPGLAGSVARALTRGLLPAGLRRAAALALGVGLVTGPVVAGCTTPPAHPGTGLALAAATAGPVPDWPTTGAAPAAPSAGPVADWPTATPAPAPSTPAPSTPVPSTPAPSTPAPSPSQSPPSPQSAPDAPSDPAATASDPAPDWPLPGPGDRVVLRGECLWQIAAGDLRTSLAREPSDAEIAASVRAWWQANAAVIGPDPDLLLPGQVLHPPAR
ncbi:hypothetical protein ACI789_14815 [Geodermatophilus sp. SYSU D00965]